MEMAPARTGNTASKAGAITGSKLAANQKGQTDVFIVKTAFHIDGVTYPGGAVLEKIPKGCEAFCMPIEDAAVEVATAEPGAKRTTKRTAAKKKA